MSHLTTNEDGRGVFLYDPPSGYWEKEAEKSLFPYVEGMLSLYLPAPGKILDLGCEAGRTSLALAKRGYQVWGVDIFNKALQFSSKRAHREQLSIHWIQAQAQALPLVGCFYDGVLLVRQFLSLFHQREVRLKILLEARRVLKNDGIILISIQNSALNPTLWHLFHYLYCRLFVYPMPCLTFKKIKLISMRLRQIIYNKTYFLLHREVRKSHNLLITTAISEILRQDVQFHQYDGKELEVDLQEAGFQVIDTRDILEFEKKRKLPAWLRKGSPYLVITARKRGDSGFGF